MTRESAASVVHSRQFSVTVLSGPSALSAFRRKGLIERLQAIDPAIEEVVARHLHFVHAAELAADEKLRLEKLLRYGVPAAVLGILAHPFALDRPVWWAMDKIRHDAGSFGVPAEWRATAGIDAFGFYGTFSVRRIADRAELTPFFERYARDVRGDVVGLCGACGHGMRGETGMMIRRLAVFVLTWPTNRDADRERQPRRPGPSVSD